MNETDSIDAQRWIGNRKKKAKSTRVKTTWWKKTQILPISILIFANLHFTDWIYLRLFYGSLSAAYLPAKLIPGPRELLSSLVIWSLQTVYRMLLLCRLFANTEFQFLLKCQYSHWLFYFIMHSVVENQRGRKFDLKPVIQGINKFDCDLLQFYLL